MYRLSTPHSTSLCTRLISSRSPRRCTWGKPPAVGPLLIGALLILHPPRLRGPGMLLLLLLLPLLAASPSSTWGCDRAVNWHTCSRHGWRIGFAHGLCGDRPLLPGWLWGACRRCRAAIGVHCKAIHWLRGQLRLWRLGVRSCLGAACGRRLHRRPWRHACVPACSVCVSQLALCQEGKDASWATLSCERRSRVASCSKC